MKLASRYMIVKKTFKKYSKIRSESFYKRKRRWFWFTGSMLTLTNPFLEAGPFPLGAFALDSSPEPRNANGGTRQRAESGRAGWSQGSRGSRACHSQCAQEKQGHILPFRGLNEGHCRRPWLCHKVCSFYFGF